MGILNNLGLAGNTASNVGNESADKAALALTIGLSMMAADVALAESQKELSELNSTVAQVQSLQSVQTRLESLTSRINNIAVDGLTQREAGFVTDSINEINEELGADLIQVPALESFGDKVSAKHYTELGLEAADSGVKKLWAWIVEMLKKIKDQFAEWWDKFFGSVEKVKAYATKVKASASKYKDDKAEKKIEVTSILRANGKPSANTITSGIEAIAKSVDEFIAKQATVTEATTDALDKAIESAEAKDGKLKTAYNTFVGNADVVKYITGSHLSTSIKADGVVFGADLMGGKSVQLVNGTTVTDGADGATASRADFYKAVAKVSYKVKGADKKEDKKESIDRLSQSQVESVADSAIQMADDILALRKSRQDARKYADAITKSVAGLQKEADSTEDDAKQFKGELSAMSKATTSVLSEVSGGAISSWTAHIVNVANAALKAAEKSI